MRTIIAAGVIIAGIPTITQAQSDLQKIGQIIQGIQQLQQNQNNGGRNQNNGGGTGTRQYKYGSGNPNASGNKNNGGFDQNSFFGPPGGGQGPRGGQIYNPPIYNGGRGNNGRIYQNGNIQNRYPSRTYPGNGTIYQGGNVYTPPTSSVPYRGSTVYADPPKAPLKSYSKLPILLRCSADSVGTCNYELITGSGSAFPYTIRGGQKQNLVETTDWAIRYRPSPSASYQTYRLRGGKTYEIRNENGNWAFYMAP